jgi:nucleotide-binding universal stress UspA family protein
MIKRLVLALDGSPEAECALPVARELALALGAAVTVVHVREMMLAPVVGGVTRRIDETAIEAAVRADVESLIAAGIEADLRIVATTYAGGPAHEIAEVAQEVDAGLIVAGTRGHGVIRGLLVGSVAHRLPYVACCPVLTVPLPSGSRDGEPA